MYKKMRIKLEPAKQKPISCERKIEREASRKEFFVVSKGVERKVK